MTLERPRTDTAMSNTGERTSQAAALRKAFPTSKNSIYARGVGNFVHILSTVDWSDE